MAHQIMLTVAVLRPEASVRITATPELAALPAAFDQNIEHALINLINNAADASKEPVRIDADLMGAGILRIRITDQGSALTATPPTAQNLPPPALVSASSWRARASNGSTASLNFHLCRHEAQWSPSPCPLPPPAR